MKLLEAGVIYAILDSNLVSHVHVVPKKGGITVITNGRNELIHTRTVTDKHLVLNWKKCHFMVKAEIVLGHNISEKGIEVDKEKIEVMMSLQPPTTVKEIRSFLGHASFYRRFIKDFSKIARPLTRLLCKETKFEFDSDCLAAFHMIKGSLISASIMQLQIGTSPSKS
ncbi:hypothetical protein N665_0077s0040 [Sinapis alba]|nr:hypothetical protein N665_0077s0040 [Sinapis alba]